MKMNNLIIPYGLVLLAQALIFLLIWKFAKVNWNTWGPIVQFFGLSLAAIGFMINSYHSKESKNPEVISKNLKAINTENSLKAIIGFRDENGLYAGLNSLESHCQSDLTPEQLEKLDSFTHNDLKQLLDKISMGDELEKTTEVFSVIYANANSVTLHNFVVSVINENSLEDEDTELAFIESIFVNYYPRRNYPEDTPELIEVLKIANNLQRAKSNKEPKLRTNLFGSFISNLKAINSLSHNDLVNNTNFIIELNEIGLIKELALQHKLQLEKDIVHYNLSGINISKLQEALRDYGLQE